MMTTTTVATATPTATKSSVTENCCFKILQKSVLLCAKWKESFLMAVKMHFCGHFDLRIFSSLVGKDNIYVFCFDLDIKLLTGLPCYMGEIVIKNMLLCKNLQT
jgi:hypothetical protein